MIKKLGKNLAATLSYCLPPVSGILFLIIEKDDKDLRFHAMQSTVYAFFVMAVQLVLNILKVIPVIGIFGSIALNVIGILYGLSLVYLMINAYMGKNVKVPIIGEVISEQIYK